MTIDEVIEIIKKYNSCCNEVDADDCVSRVCVNCEFQYSEDEWEDVVKQLPSLLEELKELKQLKDESIKKYKRLSDNKDFKQLEEWLKEIKGVKENNRNFFGKCVTEAYKNGKEDADKLLKQWKDDVIKSFCKFDANSVEEVYGKGRADALDIDMDKPMHFTDEQKAWIKNYIIINAKRQRTDAIDEFDRICEEARSHNFGVCDADFVIDVIKAKVKEQLKEKYE